MVPFDRPLLALLIAAGFCVTLVVAYGLVSWLTPRGTPLFIATAILAIGLTPMFDQWGTSARAGTILRWIGLLGTLVGLVDLSVRLLISPGTAAESPDAHTATGPAKDQPSRQRPNPGIWSALAWCLVLVTGLDILPRHVAEATAVGGFRKTVAVRNWPDRVDRAVVTDLGAARRSGGYAVVVMLCVSVGAFLAIGLACLLLRAEAGPSWPRAIGLGWPGLIRFQFAVLCGAALWLLMSGIDQAVTWMFSLKQATWGIDDAMKSLPVGIAAVGGGLMPAVVQELWFRAFIGRGLIGRFGMLPGVLVTSGLCALVHPDVRLAILAFLLGIVLHLLYLASGSLTITILVHACVSIGGLVMARQSRQFTDWMPAFGYVAAIGLVAGLAFLLSRQRPRRTPPQVGRAAVVAPP